MKSYLILAVLSVFIFAGCSSSKKVAADYDDVYYSTRTDKKIKKQEEAVQSADPDYYTNNDNASTDYYVGDYETGDYVSYEEEPAQLISDSVVGSDGNTYVTNNYYDGSGYDDYSYASRINRFYSPCSGFGYYSPYYTGFYYDPWYNPYMYRPSLYFGLSWGWGSFGYGYPYYSYPYYGSYWQGYNNGYYDGYWNGYYANSYYDYGNNAYYYGHRSTRSGHNSPYTGTAYNGGGSSAVLRGGGVERTRPVLNSGVATSSTLTKNDNSGTSRGGAVQSSSRPNEVKPSGRGSTTAVTTGTAVAASRNTDAEQKPVVKPKTDASRTSKPQSKARYTYKKPASTQNAERSSYKPGQTISSRQQTQTGRQYKKPASQSSNQRNAVSRQGSNTSRNTQSYSKPQSNRNNSYTKPSRYNTSRSSSTPSTRRTYSQPSRSSGNTYSKPSRSSSSRSGSSGSRSYSTPSRSSSSGSRSYSSPSRSSSSGSRSYSAPSRSGSSGSRSSGGSRSSSGGSRGGRR